MKLQDFDFRIWNKDEKCFLDPYTKSRAVVKNLPNEKLLNLEIELFTGLCDKNGNKIYEGDITKIITFSYDFVGHVAYDIWKILLIMRIGIVSKLLAISTKTRSC
ncbi:YopX family protein [Campylobacter coli]